MKQKSAPPVLLGLMPRPQAITQRLLAILWDGEAHDLELLLAELHCTAGTLAAAVFRLRARGAHIRTESCGGRGRAYRLTPET
jgi:hypothetical protein